MVITRRFDLDRFCNQWIYVADLALNASAFAQRHVDFIFCHVHSQAGDGGI
jgi:hypothetical protein